MEIIKSKKPKDLSIVVRSIDPSYILKDYRPVQKYGKLTFGPIGRVAQNLGVEMSYSGNDLIFTAPKNRLQRFVEKLHFAMISYELI